MFNFFTKKYKSLRTSFWKRRKKRRTRNLAISNKFISNSKEISYLEYSEENIRTITNSFNNYIDLFSKIRNNISTINEINNGELISIVLKQLDDSFNIRLIDKKIENRNTKFAYNIEKINIIRDENEKKYF